MSVREILLSCLAGLLCACGPGPSGQEVVAATTAEPQHAPDPLAPARDAPATGVPEKGIAAEGEPTAPSARAGEVPSADEDAAARTPLFDEAFVQAVYAEAVAALRDGASITLQHDVPALVLTVDEARARRKAFTQGMEENAGITAAFDGVADFVFSETMLGRYLPDEKALYIIEEVLQRSAGGDRDRAREVLFGVMAHELVHAHDDQVYAALPSPDVLMEVAADGRRLGELQTQMSLLEGHAVYAAELACHATGREPLEPITLAEARSAQVMDTDGDALAAIGGGVVNTIARTKLVQYAWGREFCKAAHSFGGERFLGQVFAHLPLTNAELEDFEVFKQRWARDMEAELEAAESAEGAAPAQPAPGGEGSADSP